MSGNAKRNIVVATMAVLVCAAVGLNWKYSSQEAVQQAEETGTKILGRPRWSPGRRIPGWRRTRSMRGTTILPRPG